MSEMSNGNVGNVGNVAKLLDSLTMIRLASERAQSFVDDVTSALYEEEEVLGDDRLSMLEGRVQAIEAEFQLLDEEIADMTSDIHAPEDISKKVD